MGSAISKSKRDNKESSHRRRPLDGGDREAQPQLPAAPVGPLPCCGCGYGWCMFISGFFLAGVPWYIAAFILICGCRRVGPREKPGFIACTIAAVGVTGALIYGLYRLLPHLIPLIMSLFGI